MPIRTLHLLAALALALLGPGLARAEGGEQPPEQVVDGYTVAIAFGSGQAQPGANDLAVTIRGPDGAPVADAAVTAAVVLFVPADNHGAAHSDSPASASDGHQDAAPADDHNAAPSDQHDAAPADSHDHSTAPADNHSAAGDGHSTAPADDHSAAGDGHSTAPADDHSAAGDGHSHAAGTALSKAEAAGSYGGSLQFEQTGTAAVRVAFTVAGQERAALFSVPVVQQRQRALVLGGFAAVNGLVILAAALLKRRTPQKPLRKPAPPAGSLPLSPRTVTAQEEHSV